LARRFLIESLNALLLHHVSSRPQERTSMSELAVDAIPPASLERVQAAHGGDRLSSSVRGGCGVAEITTKRMGELVRGVFEVLMDEPEGLPASQVVKAVEERVPPTEFEQGYYVKSPRAALREDRPVRGDRPS
jgi:hypothetical protein